ncbi:MAG: methyltransferase domain-containing protein [Phycisphaerae bacterium]
MGSDRVNELYRGEIWSRKDQQTCRDRVHWMCSRVTGERLLDVGCSQGIASLLLAQEGHQVVGVDIDPAAIEYAQNELAQGPEFLKDRVEFRLISGGELPFEDAWFDSVLMGELVEHLNRPERMLAEVRRVLKPAGTVVITTPFGMLPDPGHVRTFYLSGLVELAGQFFQPKALCVLEKYICYAGVAADPTDEADESITAPPRLLELSEEAFRRAEHSYHELLDARRARSESLGKQLAQLRTAAEGDRKQLAELWQTGSVQLVGQFRGLLANNGVGIDVAHLLKRTEHISAKLAGDARAAHQLEVLGQAIEDFQTLLEKELLAARGELELADQKHAAELERLRQEHQEQLQQQRSQLEQRRLDGLARAEHERQTAVQRERTSAARQLEAEKQRLNAAREKQAAESEQVLHARAKAEQEVRALRGRVSRQTELVDYFRAELALKQQEVRYRLGDAFVRAATNPIEFVKLPKRFVSLYFEGLRRRRERRRLEASPGAPPQPPPPAVVSAAPPAAGAPPAGRYGILLAGPDERPAAVARHRQLREDFERFANRVTESDARHVVVMFAGTKYIQNIRANRPIRLARSLERMNTPVLFNFHRWRETDHIPPYSGGLLFQSPVDRTAGFVEELVSRDLGRTRGIFIVSYPHPAVLRLVNLANVNGWATIYDCRDDWEEFQKVNMAKWYRAAVERFVVNNCDMTCCVARPLQEKLKAFSDTRPVRLSPNAYDPAFVDARYRRRSGTQVKIGYFGHLSESWFDWDSLRWIARRRPAYHFEIVGHSAPKKIKLPANVELCGPKSPTEICELAAEWQVGIITFRVGRLADGVDPIKIYEYFGLGLPVVSFRMPQIADYPCTTTVETREDFTAALDRAVREPPDPRILREFLEKNTWDDRAREMLRWADQICEPAPCEKTFHPKREAG